ncbi:hypothetical protein FRC17_001890 [Serendipita sp. 399]|nr:hypothetical protein FRC17_001890 [Serendipita sp. 399]
MSQFGNADNLDFTLSCNFYWASDQTPPGVTQTARLFVGSWSNTLSFTSSDHTWLWNTPDLTPGSPSTQSGTTSVSKSRDGTTGYVPILIDHTITRPGSGVDLRSYLIGRTFSLSGGGGGGGSGNSLSAASGSTTTSASSASSPSDVSSPPLNGAVSMSTSGTFLIPILPGVTGQPVPASIAAGGGNSVVGSTSNGGGGERVSKAGIVGGILGGLVLSGVFAFIFFLLYKRKMREVRKREEEQQQEPTAVILPETVAGGRGMGDEGDAGDGIQMRLSSMVEVGISQQGLSEAPSERANGYHDTKTTGSTSAMSSSYLPGLSSETQQTSTSQLTGEERRQQGNERGKKRSDGRSEGRGRGRRTLSSEYSSPIDTSGMDVPPPAYTDLNEMVETMNGRHYNEDEEGENDEGK